MTWNCRVIKYDTSEPWDDEYYHAIHEVFYDEEGKEITTEEYLELLLKQKRSDMDNFLMKMKRRRK